MDSETARRAALDGSVVLIDVRNPDEWLRTGIGEGAHPISMQDPAFLDTLLDLVDGDRDRPLAIVCAAGGRSAQVARALSAHGFSTVHNVDEGMMGSPAGPGWLGRGLPTVPWQG